MSIALLTTKLHIPRLRHNLVARPRLMKQLNAGLQRKLTLISAPAGFGKTTLVGEWVANLRLDAMGGAGPPIAAAWLSLDEGDNDPVRFLTYVVAALQTLALSQAEGAEASVGKGVLSALQSPQPLPIEAALTALINEMAALPGRVVLVLDDYHVIDAKPVDNALIFLLEHLPPQIQLVIATREDPHLPLARLRVRGQLTEVRVADLRFTHSEAAVFLNHVMGLDLSAESIAALEMRTEGWIAGLQMAALSIQGRADTASFIRAFAGSHHFVLDYLVEEVLQRQPERVRTFLLQTSILDRLCGPLCDAVCFGMAETSSSSTERAVRVGKVETSSSSTGTAVTVEEDGKEMLEVLERGNLFVVPLDDKREWYRYHHLFADVLQAHLMEEQPDQVAALHRRASERYGQNGSPADAVRHALAAEDFERAASLVELAWPAMDKSFKSAAWLGWAKALPDELVCARPVLSADYAWALLNEGELAAGEARLRDAERWLDATPDLGEQSEAPSGETGAERSRRAVVVDEEQFRSLPVTIASARAYYAQARGDVRGTVKYAGRALALLPEGDHFARGRAAVLLGLAHWTSGELEEAHRAFTDAMASFRMAGNILFAISFTFILADIRRAQGRLHEALRACEQSLLLAAGQGESVLPGTADLHLGLSELYLEQGDMEAARQHLATRVRLGEQSEVYQWRLCVAQARMKEVRGDLDGALDLLREAESLYCRNPIPDVRPMAALKTRVWVAQGRLTDALGWARERGLSVDDELSYLLEFEHVTLARVLIAQYKSDRVERSIQEAMGLLERLLKAAEEGGRTGSVIEILVLQALAHHATGDTPAALVSLERALVLAEPEGYVRIFVDEGPPMAALLGEAAIPGAAPNYVNQLRAACGKAENRTTVTQLLIEPLSERELEVLRLLGTELTGPEIARELVVSLNTIRTHTKNIYSKLGVNNRRAAVRRAEELDLS